MKKINKRIVFLTALTSVAVFVMIVSIFTLITLSQVPLKKLERISPSETRGYGEESVLEAGSVVNGLELETFYTFSRGKLSFSQWKKRAREKDQLVWHSDGTVDIKSKLSLPPLLQNDCLHIYCFQHRMAFDQIPSVFWKGLIGIEDYRFLDHFGIDLQSIARALWVDIREMSLVQGGSTLTQQLVKNLFFTNEKTLTRKLKEVVVAIYIESLYPKESILEAYFNEVFWGSFQGIRIKGVYSASLFYFNKTPQDISPFEASILIGLLKGPYYYHPLRSPERLKARTEVVFNKLIEQGFYSESTAKRWSEKDWDRWLTSLQKRSERRHLKSLWHSYESDKSFLSPYEQWVMIHGVQKSLKYSQTRVKGEANLAAKVFLKSASSLKSSGEAFRYYSKIERSLEEAMENERHQVGSTLKPIIYREFVRSGKQMGDEVSTEPLTLELKSGKWSPGEAAGHENGPKKITLYQALLKSYNRPVVRISKEIGFDVMEEGLLTYFPNLKRPLGEYPAQLLGAIELSVSELASAYSSFVLFECQDKNTAQSYDIEGKSLMDLMSDPTRTTIKNVVNRDLAQMRFFGKTGTSNSGYDNWFVFFDGDHLGVIWLGYEGLRGEKDLNLFGSVSAYPIFQHFLTYRGKRFPHMGCAKVLGDDAFGK